MYFLPYSIVYCFQTVGHNPLIGHEINLTGMASIFQKNEIG